MKCQVMLSILSVFLNKLNKFTNIVLRRRDTKESVCLLWDITTEKSGLCCYAVRITLNTYVKE